MPLSIHFKSGRQRNGCSNCQRTFEVGKTNGGTKCWSSADGGKFSEDNYDWIHGFLSKNSIASELLKFWYAHRKGATKPCTNEKCNENCSACKAEVRRRNRSLHVVKTNSSPIFQNTNANSHSEMMENNKDYFLSCLVLSKCLKTSTKRCTSPRTIKLSFTTTCNARENLPSELAVN